MDAKLGETTEAVKGLPVITSNQDANCVDVSIGLRRCKVWPMGFPMTGSGYSPGTVSESLLSSIVRTVGVAAHNITLYQRRCQIVHATWPPHRRHTSVSVCATRTSKLLLYWWTGLPQDFASNAVGFIRLRSSTAQIGAYEPQQTKHPDPALPLTVVPM